MFQDDNIQHGFDSLLFLVGWMTWKERNMWMFDGSSASPAELTQLIIDRTNVWLMAGFKQLKSLMVLL